MFFFFIATALASSCTHKDFSMCSSNNAAVSWDYLLLVETWVGQYCYSNCCDPPTYTGGEIRTGFTLHGWWPNFVSGYPSCCKSDVSDSAVTSLIENDSDFKYKLAYNWPSLNKCKFFQYEYDKHGTCVSDVYSGSNGPKEYANAAIYLLNKYDFYTTFKNNGIKMDGSSTNSKSTMRTLAENLTGVSGSVYFTCSSSKYLSELRVCTTVTTATKSAPKVIACPSGVVSGAETCGDSIILEEVPNFTDTGCEY